MSRSPQEGLYIGDSSVVDVGIGCCEPPDGWVGCEGLFHVLVYEGLEVETQLPEAPDDHVRADAGVTRNITARVVQDTVRRVVSDSITHNITVRAPDSGLRTPDSGLRTPDSGVFDSRFCRLEVRPGCYSESPPRQHRPLKPAVSGAEGDRLNDLPTGDRTFERPDTRVLEPVPR